MKRYLYTMKIPELSNKAFWDVRFSEIDFEKNALHVMEKVFNFGTWDDQIALMKFYGLERIKKEIINASYLRKPVIGFLCIILDLQRTDFRCYRNMQSHQLPWVY